MTVMLHRPSPQIPEPSVASAQICFDAASFNIGMHRQQIATKSVDITWIFTQSLFMALNTVLWSISHAEVREKHSKEELKKLLSTAQEGINLAAKRWPGVESALALYDQLGDACLKAYDYRNVTFRLAGSSAAKPWCGHSQVTHRHHQPRNSSATTNFLSSTHNDYHADRLLSKSYPLQTGGLPILQANSSPERSENTVSDSGQSNSSRSDFIRQPTFTTTLNRSSGTFPLNLPDLRPWAPPTQQVPEQYLGFIGDQYLQYSHVPYVHQSMRPLSEEEQVELMKNLETNGLYGGTPNALNEPLPFFPNPDYAI